MHVDDGLMTQSQAQMAELSAVLATVFAVIGSAAASFRVLRVGRLALQVGEMAPELTGESRLNIARVLTKNPELIAKIRTTTELEELLQKLGKNLSFEETEEICQLAYHRLGLNPVSYSRQSFDEFLENVWRDQSRIARAGTSERPWGGIYDLYSSTTQGSPLTRPVQTELNEIASIASERPTGSLSVIQGKKLLPELGDQISASVRAAETNAALRKDLGDTFFHFLRADPNMAEMMDKMTQRVYLNVSADSSTDVMRYVVRNVVDNPNDFPGVGAAKLMGPAGAGQRADTIIIWAEDQAAADRVLAQLRSYHRANPSLFEETTPPMTNRVMEGISTAAQPTDMAESFGSLRSRIIYKALRSSMQKGETYDQFVQRVIDSLGEGGVNPNAPHLNQ